MVDPTPVVAKIVNKGNGSTGKFDSHSRWNNKPGKSGGYSEEDDINDKIQVYLSKPNGNNKFSNIIGWKKDLKKYCKENNIDTVIGIGIKYGTICAYALKSIKNINLIVRGTSTYKLSILEKIAVFLFGGRINKFVCQTVAQSKSIPNRLSEKSIVISNPFETYDTNNNTNGFLSKKFICVGRLKLGSKKQDNIIDAFSAFNSDEKFHNYSLHFYGDDCDNGKTLAYLKTKVMELKLENVCFHPFCSDIKKQICGSTAFICCSVAEGMPNALIESMMLGIPAISSDWKGSEEIVINGKNGYIFGNYNDINGLSSFMKLVAELTETEYSSLSDSAFSLNKENYSLNKIISTWESIL